MFYTYVLRSKKDGNFYTGFTNNLKERYKLHKLGKIISTKHRSELDLVYFEACTNEIDAIRREKYLKSGTGKKFLNYRLKYGLQELKGRGPNELSV